jgi:apolipoprotein N-acyltransferase
VFGQQFLQSFVDDPTVRVIAVAWVLDFLLGVFAAFKAGTFRLSYVADTFRNDVIGKILPYYTLWAALHVTGIDWSIGGLDVIEEGAGALVIGALVGSILNSLRDLGLAKTLPDTIAGPDPETATPPPSDQT